MRVANVFHAGDGNLHPLILFDGKETGALEKAEALAAEIIHLCLTLGGSITGEHGIGMEKRQFMPDMFSPVEMDLFRQLRLSIDPKEISNRGKMFPAGEAPSLTQIGMHPLEKKGIVSRE
jgi:glycolate oxidase